MSYMMHRAEDVNIRFLCIEQTEDVEYIRSCIEQDM